MTLWIRCALFMFWLDHEIIRNHCHRDERGLLRLVICLNSILEVNLHVSVFQKAMMCEWFVLFHVKSHLRCHLNWMPGLHCCCHGFSFSFSFERRSRSHPYTFSIYTEFAFSRSTGLYPYRKLFSNFASNFSSLGDHIQ